MCSTLASITPYLSPHLSISFLASPKTYQLLFSLKTLSHCLCHLKIHTTELRSHQYLNSLDILHVSLFEYADKDCLSLCRSSAFIITRYSVDNFTITPNLRQYVVKLLIYYVVLVRSAGLEPTPQASETCTLSS